MNLNKAERFLQKLSERIPVPADKQHEMNLRITSEGLEGEFAIWVDTGENPLVITFPIDTFTLHDLTLADVIATVAEALKAQGLQVEVK